MSDRTEQPDPTSGEDESPVAAVLRSAGSLLLALSGDLRRLTGGESREAARHAAPSPEHAPSPEQTPAPAASVPGGPGDASETVGDTAGQIERTLEEARQRAHAVIDESVRRAHELIERARPTVESIPDRLQSTLDRLFDELRAIRTRLDRVEQLLAAGRPAIPAPADPAPPPPPAGAESPRPAAASPPPPLSLVDADRGFPPPATAPPATPPPPMPHHAPPPPAVAAAPAASPAPPPPPIARDEGDAGLVFMPEDGSLIVAVGPVSGFQGLVRVQDALTDLPGVGEVAVEAYARGEARLRLQLAGPVRASELAAQLADRLTQSTDISEQSRADRSVRLRLG